MQLLGPGNGLGAEVDADAVGRRQRGEQLTAAAAQFQHPLAGRYQEAHELAVVLAIGGIVLARAVQFVAVGLEVPQKLEFSLRIGGCGNHDSLERSFEFKTLSSRLANCLLEPSAADQKKYGT
jgi:hypothetical protein